MSVCMCRARAWVRARARVWVKARARARARARVCGRGRVRGREGEGERARASEGESNERARARGRKALELCRQLQLEQVEPREGGRAGCGARDRAEHDLRRVGEHDPRLERQPRPDGRVRPHRRSDHHHLARLNQIDLRRSAGSQSRLRRQSFVEPTVVPSVRGVPCKERPAHAHLLAQLEEGFGLCAQREAIASVVSKKRRTSAGI